MKIIEGFSNYKIDESGNIISIKKNLPIKKQVNIDGYYVVNLYVNGKDYHKRVCRLVAQAYLEDYSEDLVVNHKDLNKKNDHVSNLEMVTIKQNNHHSVTLQPEVHRKKSQYTKEQILELCEILITGVDCLEASRITGISYEVVTKVRNKTTWKWLIKDYNFPRYSKKITEEMAAWVSQMLIKGYMPTPILRMCPYEEVSIDCIKSIKAGKTWVDIYQRELAKTFNDHPERE